MNPYTRLLQTFVDRTADVGDEYLKIYKDEDGWNIETARALTIRTQLPDAIEVALEKIREEYPDPEEAERAEYERLRLKFGGDPLPEPELPGVWVGLDWDGDSWYAQEAFAEELAAQAWVLGDAHNRSTNRVPYHES